MTPPVVAPSEARTSVPRASLFLLCCAAAVFSPATPSRAARPTTAQIDEAVQKLGDDDPAVRKAGSRFLWSAGSSAEGELKAAAASPDPEVAARAAAVLDDFRTGLTPDAPAELRGLVARYRAGDATARQAAAAQLLQDFPKSLPVVLHLTARDPDAEVRKAAFRRLTPSAAGWCLAVGEPDLAEEMLRSKLDEGQAAARQPYVAFLALHGGIDARIAELKANPARPAADAILLALLYRAKGDLAAADAAAKTSGDEPLQNGIARERHEYGRLAAYYAARAVDPAGGEDLNFAAAYAKAAGDDKALSPLIDRLCANAREAGPAGFEAAKALFLLDRPADGLDALKARGQKLLSGTLLWSQLNADEALKVLDAAKEEDPVLAAFETTEVLAALGEEEKGGESADAARRLCGPNSPPRVGTGGDGLRPAGAASGRGRDHAGGTRGL